MTKEKHNIVFNLKQKVFINQLINENWKNLNKSVVLFLYLRFFIIVRPEL